jgi:replicative DNA helicase
MICLEIESKVLNAMCCFDDCLNDGMSNIKVDYFSDCMNKKIFETIKVMYSADKSITLMTVYEEMKNILTKNHTKWMMIDQCFCSSSEFEYLTSRLAESCKKRKINNLALYMTNSIVDDVNSTDIIKYVQDNIYSIDYEKEDVKIITPNERATSIMTTISERMENKSSGGITTSYAKLNKAINGGFQPSELIILAAETGKGKTAMAMNIARDIAIIQKYPTLYINTEMNEKQWDTRLATILTRDHANITYSKIATGELAQGEFDTIVDYLTVMSNSEFYSVTMPELDIDGVISVTNRFKSQKDIKVLIVDYVGRMETNDKKLKEYQVMKGIAKRLKTLAQKLEITIILLAQLNGEEKLEGAKSMENEADLFFHLQEMNEGNIKEYNGKWNYYMVINKNRNGPKGRLLLNFNGSKMLFKGEVL